MHKKEGKAETHSLNLHYLVYISIQKAINIIREKPFKSRLISNRKKKKCYSLLIPNNNNSKLMRRRLTTDVMIYGRNNN